MSSLPEEAFVAALSLLPAVGPARLRALLDIGAPAEVWRAVVAGDVRVDRVAGRTDRSVAWRAAAAQIDVGERWRSLHESGVGVLWRGGTSFPEMLADDPEPPELLFTRGDPACFGPQRVAIVGTRRCTRYGHDLAYELGAVLGAAGVTVVSGLARGIDAAAHRGALDADEAPPVAVVGTAIDTPYPRENASMWHEIADRGLVCGETPPGAPTERWRFPARNRIIAGFADLVIVVESAERGGSLYTATQAFDRGRVVLAVPGPVRSEVSLGTNRLLADGAHPLCEVSDVLEILGLVAPVPVIRVDDPELSSAATDVVDALGWHPSTLDEIAVASGLELADLALALHELEAAGRVTRRGSWYEQVHRIRPAAGSNGP